MLLDLMIIKSRGRLLCYRQNDLKFDLEDFNLRSRRYWFSFNLFVEHFIKETQIKSYPMLNERPFNMYKHLISIIKTPGS